MEIKDRKKAEEELKKLFRELPSLKKLNSYRKIDRSEGHASTYFLCVDRHMSHSKAMDIATEDLPLKEAAEVRRKFDEFRYAEEGEATPQTRVMNPKDDPSYVPSSLDDKQSAPPRGLRARLQHIATPTNP